MILGVISEHWPPHISWPDGDLGWEQWGSEPGRERVCPTKAGIMHFRSNFKFEGVNLQSKQLQHMCVQWTLVIPLQKRRCGLIWGNAFCENRGRGLEWGAHRWCFILFLNNGCKKARGQPKTDLWLEWGADRDTNPLRPKRATRVNKIAPLKEG